MRRLVKIARPDPLVFRSSLVSVAPACPEVMLADDRDAALGNRIAEQVLHLDDGHRGKRLAARRGAAGLGDDGESRAGGPTVAVEVNVTGEPASPSTSAVVVYGPGSSPSVRSTCARPALLVAVVASDTDPPTAAVQTTDTLGTGLSLASVTRTTRGSDTCAPTAAL